ncbi:MAG: TetR/AcrR family transcriptional regulator [Oscillospiraceae bacterium]|nr:TetR/AcrR family transcriptional regulator [Oscillospiraceae bacterium]
MKTDARVRYTRKVIRDAFLDILKEKPVSKITVKEICDQAEINRGTFYKHYRDCYDLLHQIEEEGLREFEKMLASIQATGTQAAVEAILRTLQSNSQLIRGLDNSTDGQRFINRLAGRCFLYMEQWLGPVPQNTPAPAKRDAGFAFMAGGSSSVIEWWLRSGMKEPLETVAALIVACSESVAAGLSV